MTKILDSLPKTIIAGIILTVIVVFAVKSMNGNSDSEAVVEQVTEEAVDSTATEATEATDAVADEAMEPAADEAAATEEATQEPS